MHLIQPGNWRGARDAGNSLVKTEKLKPIIQHEKNRGTGLVKSTGTSPNSTGTGTGPDRNSGRVLVG